MFLFRSNPSGRSTVNAIPEPEPQERSETAEERTARHLAMCRRLADLGMQMAEAAAEQALAQAENPDAPRPKGPDPSVTYVRLCASVRQSIALEAKILAGPAKTRKTRKRYDPRRPILKRLFKEGTERHHDPAGAAAALMDYAEEALDADPDAKRELCEFVFDASDATGIPILKRTLSDEMLNIIEKDPGGVENNTLLKPVPAWLIPYMPKGPGPPKPPGHPAEYA
jgi:hypothetical protein